MLIWTLRAGGAKAARRIVPPGSQVLKTKPNPTLHISDRRPDRTPVPLSIPRETVR